MQHLQINIRSVEDDKPSFETATPENTIIGKMSEFSILEKGTVSGDVSVAFLIELGEGKKVMAEMTGNIFRGAAAAFKGAEKRFIGYNK